MDHRIDRLRQRASQYLRAGQAAAAVASLESLLQRAPEDDRARLDLALARLHLDQHRAAHALTLEACDRNPGDTELALARLEALRAFALHGRMNELASSMTELDQIPAPSLTKGAALLESAGALEQAQRWIDAAIRRAPHEPSVRVNRAMIALDMGRIADAEIELDAVTSGGVLVPVAHWLLAGLRRQTPESNHVARLEALLSLPGLDADAVAYLAFALHKELDDLGHHRRAWDALERGCAAKRSMVRWDEPGREALVDALIHAFAEVQPAEASTPPDGAVTPIFIVGMHRSGTSLLERVLEAHPLLAAGGESMRFTAEIQYATDHHCADVIDQTALERLDRIDPRELGRRWLEAQRWLSEGRTHVTEKLPLNWMVIGLIRKALPHAKVLHLVRDPVEVGWSNLRELFAGGTAPWSYDLVQQAREYVRYRRLMVHWRRVLPGFIHDVAYADLVSEPERTARRVFDFCGLSWIEDSVAVERRQGAVRSASAVQVRQPIHVQSQHRWRAYAQMLEPLRVAALSS